MKFVTKILNSGIKALKLGRMEKYEEGFIYLDATSKKRLGLTAEPPMQRDQV
jgi:hypothetical protein